VGPWIVTADEIPDPQALSIACLVNGDALQDSTTANMFFGVRTLISYCSRAFTLEPGDLIATGTPAGVGVYKNPPRLLRDGDEMVIRIERIGDLRNVCRTTGEPTG
jgi:2-keto-4-pentenoate hydratase/2-oxohepta-3-ene-1,7-dioic acid hydratase in catechol pathway